MIPRLPARIGPPAMLALAAAAGAYAALAPTPPATHADGPLIVVETPTVFYDACPTPTPKSVGQPLPRPINPGQGQPLSLNPVDICPDAASFRVSVLDGPGRLVTRSEGIGGEEPCFNYYAWDIGEEITSGCSGSGGDNLGAYQDREIFMKFYGDDPVTLSVQCGCNEADGPIGAPEIVSVTPPPAP